DFHVTGVQTCALPISRSMSFRPPAPWARSCSGQAHFASSESPWRSARTTVRRSLRRAHAVHVPLQYAPGELAQVDFFEVYVDVRSEERRVGKACSFQC